MTAAVLLLLNLDPNMALKHTLPSSKFDTIPSYAGLDTAGVTFSLLIVGSRCGVYELTRFMLLLLPCRRHRTSPAGVEKSR